MRRHADDALLERLDVGAQPDAQPLEVENRIDDQLSRTVEGDVASAVDVVELRPEPLEHFAPDEQVLGMAALAQRIDRRMLDQQQRADILCASLDCFGGPGLRHCCGSSGQRFRSGLLPFCGSGVLPFGCFGLFCCCGVLPFGCFGLFGCRGAAGCTLCCEQGVEELPLEFPAAAIVHRPEVAQTEFHRYKLFTLRSASSARYDDRTNGALAQ